MINNELNKNNNESIENNIEKSVSVTPDLPVESAEMLRPANFRTMDLAKKMAEAKEKALISKEQGYEEMDLTEFGDKMSVYWDVMDENATEDENEENIKSVKRIFYEMTQQGYKPSVILNATEIIAHVIYTGKSMPDWCHLNPDMCPKTLCDLFEAASAYAGTVVSDTDQIYPRWQTILDKIFGADVSPVWDYSTALKKALTRRIEVLEACAPYDKNGNKKVVADETKMWQYLQLLGANIRIMVGNGSKYMGWRKLTKALAATLRTAAKRLGFPLEKSDFEDSLETEARKNPPFNPGLEWLDMLRKEYIDTGIYISGTDYIAAFCKYFPDKFNVYEAGLHEWIVRNIINYQKPGSERLALVLTGAQGAGKDLTAKYLFSGTPDEYGKLQTPPKRKEDLWYGHNNDCWFRRKQGDFDEKYVREITHALAGFIGVALSEVQVTSKTENRFKGLITGESMSQRMLHTEDESGEIAYSAIIASCDHVSFNRKQARRVRTAEFTNTVPDYGFLSIDPNLLWCQVIDELDHGIIYEPDEATKQRMLDSAEAVVIGNPIKDLVSTYFTIGEVSAINAVTHRSCEISLIPVTEFKQALKVLGGENFSLTGIENALREMGSTRKNTYIYDCKTWTKQFDEKLVPCYRCILPTLDTIAILSAKGVFTDPLYRAAVDVSKAKSAQDQTPAATPTTDSIPAADANAAIRAEVAVQAVSYTMDGPQLPIADTADEYEPPF